MARLPAAAMRTQRPDPYAGLSDDDWWVPELLPADPGGAPLLSPSQLQTFATRGFLVVDGLWPQPLVEAATAEIEELLPPSAHAETADIPGSDGLVVLPCHPRGEDSPEMAVNSLPVCPRALGAVAQLLQVERVSDIRLSQCHCSIKHGRLAQPEHGAGGDLAGDQDMHLYPPTHPHTTATPSCTTC